MIVIQSRVRPDYCASLEELANEMASDLEKVDDLSTMARGLTQLDQEAIDRNIGTESAEGAHRKYVQIGVESVMIAAIAAAAVAAAGIIYKIYKYFADKKTSDDFDDTIGTIDDLDDLDEKEIEEKVTANLHDMKADLNSNAALVALAMKQNSNSLLYKVPSPKDFISKIELLPSIADVRAANGKLGDDDVRTLDREQKAQYDYLVSFCKRFHIKSPGIEKWMLVGAPKKGYADASYRLMEAISQFAATSNDKPTIKPETLAREFFSAGMSDTLKAAKREVEDLEEYAERLATSTEKAKERLEGLRRQNNNLEGQQVSDTLVLYIDYVKAISMMYKINTSIQLRVNHYIKSVSSEVKSLVKE